MKRLFLVLGLIALLALPALAQQAIEVGQSVTGTYDGTSPQIYALSLKEGDTIVIDMVSEEFDTFLELYDSNALLIANDDDSGSNLNARIIFVAPAEGRYLIHARGFASNGGAFTLSVERFEIQTIAYGDTVNLSGPERCNFTFGFSGAAGDVVDIALESADSDLSYKGSFTLTDPNGFNTFSDFSSPQLRRHVLESSGTYRISVELGPDICAAETPVQLSLSQSERLPISAQPLEIEFNNLEVFDFSAEANKTYRFTVEVSPAGRAFSFRIIGMFLYQDLSFDFSGGSRISIDLPFSEGGDYRLEARSYFDFLNIGPVKMKVSVAEVE